MKKLVIIGGSGNGTVALSTALDINKLTPTWEILGFINDFESEINGIRVLGPIDKEVVQELLSDPEVFFVYSLITSKFREEGKNRLLSLEIPIDRYATLVHPTAVISEFANIGYGCTIQPFVSIGPNVEIGNHVQIFAQSLVGHDAIIENYSYIANNSCIGAKVIMKEGAYLGTNSSTKEFLQIGSWSFVGMGAVVIKDVPGKTVVIGNPAKPLRVK